MAQMERSGGAVAGQYAGAGLDRHLLLLRVTRGGRPARARAVEQAEGPSVRTAQGMVYARPS
ncbi:hypothetical protein GCM10010442_05280 [Kitasatospora kifunensis]